MKSWMGLFFCIVFLFSFQLDVYSNTDFNSNNFVNLGLKNINSTIGRENNVTVAVIDTGLNQSDFNFKSNIIQDGDIQDENGHGTLMACIIDQISNYGLGKGNISLLPIKFLDKDGQDSASKLAESITYAVDHDVDIINLSLELYSYSKEVITAVKYAEQKGVLIIAASGNNHEGLLSFPATLNDVLSVGSAEGTTVSNFSNYGLQLDLVAPDSFFFTKGERNIQYFGTSISAAEVTGLAAIIKSIVPGLTPDKIRELLRQYSTDIAELGWDIYSGNGMINISDLIKQNIKVDNINDLMYMKFLSTFKGITLNTRGQFTRGKFIDSVVYAMGLNRDPNQNIFSDVLTNTDSSGAVGAAYANHIILGYPDKTFRPNAVIDEKEAGEVLSRVYDFYNNY